MGERSVAMSAIEGWRVVGASAAGSAHEARGLPCQDAWSWRQLADGRLALVVCDGAGSAARAELGAATAADAWIAALESSVLDAEIDALSSGGRTSDTPRRSDARETREEAPASTDWRDEVIPFDEPAPDDPEAPSAMEVASALEEASGTDNASHPNELLDPEHSDSPATRLDEAWRSEPAMIDLAAAVSLARKALARLADSEGRPLRDFACTLSGLVVTPERLLAVQVGDSVAVARDPAGEWHTVGRPQKDGEYANEAHFLTAEDALARMEIRAFDFVPTALVSASDGLLRLMLQLPSLQPHPPFVEPLLRFVAGAPSAAGAADRLAGFLASSKVRARTDDDTTLLIALQQTGSGTSVPDADRAITDPGPASSREVPVS